jgi:predicted nucleotidyltransferase
MIQHAPTDILTSRLKQYLMPEGIVAIYLYGSAIKGKLRVDSDVDLAILSSYDLKDTERLELISKVEGAVTSILRGFGMKYEISVVDMRGRYMSVMLQYKIVTEGIPVYEADPAQRVEFENALKGEYFDFQPYISSLRRKKYGSILQKV